MSSSAEKAAMIVATAMAGMGDRVPFGGLGDYIVSQAGPVKAWLDDADDATGDGYPCAE